MSIEKTVGEAAAIARIKERTEGRLKLVGQTRIVTPRSLSSVVEVTNGILEWACWDLLYLLDVIDGGDEETRVTRGGSVASDLTGDRLVKP